MPPEGETSADRALKSVEELSKTIVATSGIMITLMWGLIQRENLPPSLLSLIRWSSIVFVVSIFFAFLTCQFIIAKLESSSSEITKHPTVAISFLIGWLAFLAGCALLLIAIFNVG